MGDTASEGTTEHTFCVVGGIVGDVAKVPAQVFSQDALARRYALWTHLASHFPVTADIFGGEEESMKSREGPTG